jgi:hypothetical protein
VTQVFQVAASVTNYTITYSGNSNTAGSAPSATTGSGSVSLAAQGNLVRDNFTFGGWLIGGQTYAAGANYNLTADVTAAAVWTAVVVVAPVQQTLFVLTFGAPTSSSGSVPTALVGEFFTIPGNTGALTRDGHIFAGWIINGVEYLPGERVLLTSNSTAFAYWVPKTVRFVDPVTSEGLLPQLEGLDTVVLPASSELTRTGYTLAGWSIDGVRYEPGETLTVDGIITAQAVWEPVASEVSGEIDELAQTGFETLHLFFFSLLLSALGGTALVYARRRD